MSFALFGNSIEGSESDVALRADKRVSRNEERVALLSTGRKIVAIQRVDLGSVGEVFGEGEREGENDVTF